ncbi:UDP-2,4-diacetamido-2,4,6-trideoxy-beta-L-altropyranose hydrolase [Shewanella olleyana]|uniref:UDP-2,4-diacetamido-2,4, 6-trideoxy-beta-L-altropyranose hydrolase n=1 Tax=Shewanella olleyana TaxID=135626 RepID=UPI00200FD278|nr:UDP-2,4-diacetamido-2,4,6-trideoxy-beta-L-altropyranose hydrolase [Shewanella olleyana]MCL1066586.1 UDP-2,4-diacetamido-2,4,6-trideoxy-beta-L-altropyranose hydrolase [Shewanella olleyana]
MKKIVFRVNAGKGVGVGHLVRCCSLATELIKLGHHCDFLLGSFDVAVTPFLVGFKHHFLYAEGDINQEEPDWQMDAKFTKDFLHGKQVDWLIIDDYNLGHEWESQFVEMPLCLMAIDDLCRLHCCDALLDVRWRGQTTNESYQKLIPKGTDTLLGPQYALLNQQYKQSGSLILGLKPFTVLVGIGGAGDSHTAIEIIDALIALTQIPQLIIKPILGPLTENKQLLLDKYKTLENVKPIEDCFDLYPHLSNCHLYIGAAGGILYQLKALNKPAITFSLASNQQTAHADLEGIGHYFHCEDDFNVDQVAKLVTCFAEHYSRIIKMKPKAVQVDGLGASRVAQFLVREQVPNLQATFYDGNTQCSEFESLSEHYRIRKVTDGDINHYLDSRNLSTNSQNMIQTKPIARLGHYTWWFNSQRESFLLEKHHQPSLYIWHQVQQYQKRQFLIGGWFVCNGESSFQDALIALNWQLEHCDLQWPNLPWVAVIHRENRYVKLMNDYLGFKEITLEHKYYDAIGSIFADASHDDFYYVIREPVANSLSPLVESQD